MVETLEETKLPFLWSLNDNLRNVILPKGFVERTRKRGKIVPWTPQRQVLSHDSVRVFVTLCGYNSMAESAANGVPMICRPLWADNFMNAKMVEELWRIGVRVEGGIFTMSGLVEALEVISGQEGEKMMERASELKEVLFEASGANGSATNDLRSLAELLVSVNF